jgi:hypothetical protein
MRNQLFAIGILLALTGCGSSPNVPLPPPASQAVVWDVPSTVELVPTQYRHRLVQQLSVAEDNQQSVLAAINAAPAGHREAMAYLLVNMPERDLKELSGDYLLKNVELAYKARAASDWAKAIPQEIFFADVLPYANLDETREDWRRDFFDRFMPLVKNAKSAAEAEQILNREIFPMVNVKYHATKRLKPNQSPGESIKCGYASCTGLSIMLTDACRAVGVPARVAGTPAWSDHSGNHTWTEVWDRQWYFVGSAEPGHLNRTWFVDNAAKADDSQPDTRIYAVSFEPTDTVFPLVWAPQQTDVHAVNVTGYYTGRRSMSIIVPANDSVQIRQHGILQAASDEGSATFSLAIGQVYNVQLRSPDGNIVKSRLVSLGSDSPTGHDVPIVIDFSAGS